MTMATVTRPADVELDVVNAAPPVVRLCVPAGEVRLTAEAVEALILRLKLAAVQARAPRRTARPVPQGRLPYPDD